MTFPYLDDIVKALASIVLAGIIRLGFMAHTFFTNHAAHIQTAAEEARDAARLVSQDIKTIPTAIEKQTSIIVAELQEQRQDLRTISSKL